MTLSLMKRALEPVGSLWNCCGNIVMVVGHSFNCEKIIILRSDEARWSHSHIFEFNIGSTFPEHVRIA